MISIIDYPQKIEVSYRSRVQEEAYTILKQEGTYGAGLKNPVLIAQIRDVVRGIQRAHFGNSATLVFSGRSLNSAAVIHRTDCNKVLWNLMCVVTVIGIFFIDLTDTMTLEHGSVCSAPQLVEVTNVDVEKVIASTRAAVASKKRLIVRCKNDIRIGRDRAGARNQIYKLQSEVRARNVTIAMQHEQLKAIIEIAEPWLGNRVFVATASGSRVMGHFKAREALGARLENERRRVERDERRRELSDAPYATYA